MKIFHLDLKLTGNDYAEFHCFWENPNDYQSRQLPLAQIEKLIEEAERDYYPTPPKDDAERIKLYIETGKALYNWLDGSERLLEGEINKHRGDGIILAIAATERLAHLPWELLHDKQGFLVERAIVPVRWTSDDSIKQLTPENQPKNRVLNMLFMASSPIDSRFEELDFEAEEGRILEATKRIPLSLIVEESGSLKELGQLVQEHPPDYLDVLHLTGHAIIDIENQEPYFITETELGEPEYSSAKDIADKLQFNLPKLIFLSGCQTGYSSDKGAVPSIAESLLMEGATAVLSWGKKVSDTNAIAAAATLYENLSAGSTVTQAVAKTFQILIRNKAEDWHMLRLYVAKTLPEALVTRYREPERKPAPSYSRNKEAFRDEKNKLRVVAREDFVGRRRYLQNCLRTFKTDEEKVGVLIYGMGGLGKSTIASRLWDRLSQYEKVFWWRQINESEVVNELAKKLRKPELQQLREYLLNNNVNIETRLAHLFEELSDKGEEPLLLVFDDFEFNLEPRDERYVLKPEVVKVLKALVEAIQNSRHRIIITCRHNFEFNLRQYFCDLSLNSLQKIDLQKKLRQLDAFNLDRIDKKLIERALKLADGNPRLLEFLNEVLLKESADLELSKIEANSQEWERKIIWEDFCNRVEADQKIQRIISRCLVFEIPVPLSALEAVCDSIPDNKKQLSRAVDLGLIEANSELEESNRLYRVSRILPHIFPNIHLPKVPQVYSLYQKAYEKLHELWGNDEPLIRGQETKIEERWEEIFRLKFANRENPERFRQGFSQMLAIENNRGADSAFESELRKSADDLVKDELYTSLENYLKQKQWIEADEETAWIFYQVMVKGNYKSWQYMLKNFPRETLKEIDRLWQENSNNKFGISIQTEIYQSLGGTKSWDDKIWDKFCDRVGWRRGDKESDRQNYDDIMMPLTDITTDITQAVGETSGTEILGKLPALIYTRSVDNLILAYWYNLTPSMYTMANFITLHMGGIDDDKDEEMPSFSEEELKSLTEEFFKGLSESEEGLKSLAERKTSLSEEDFKNFLQEGFENFLQMKLWEKSFNKAFRRGWATNWGTEWKEEDEETDEETDEE